MFHVPEWESLGMRLGYTYVVLASFPGSPCVYFKGLESGGGLGTRSTLKHTGKRHIRTGD